MATFGCYIYIYIFIYYPPCFAVRSLQWTLYVVINVCSLKMLKGRETTSAFVFRSVNMEGLMERLERAVTRLEKLSVTMQDSSSLANGGCVNGVDGGKSPFRSEKRSREKQILLRLLFESRCKFVPVCVKIYPRLWRRSTSSWTVPWRSTWRSAKPSETRWRNM